MSSSISLINQSLSDPQSREKFCAAFKAAVEELNLSDLEVAQRLQISRPTVEHWKSGEAAVHPVGRKPILKYLLHCLRAVGLREIVLEAKSL